MWEKGISAYIGIGHSLATIRGYLRLARSYGYTRLFTSLHIPEADAAQVLTDFRSFIKDAAVLGFSVTVDISPAVLGGLGASFADLSALKAAGLSAIRLDYGFAPEQIAAITRSGGLDVELNASTVTPDILHSLERAQADFSKLRACHNYYPRPETGLSFSLFTERCRLLHDYHIPVSAFIPSRGCPRGPVFAGLPTLEKHRLLPPGPAAKELLASELVNGIIFGDPLAPETELAAVAALTSECIELQAAVEPDISPLEREILFSITHTNRRDPGECVIRSEQARSLVRADIPARAPKPRPVGAVTVDNQDYHRYMGEMQIVLAPLPPDRRVNVAAHVIPEEIFLLSYIGPGKAFRLKERTCHEF